MIAPLPTIVTAADAGYWRCLYQFLRSAERKRLTASHRFIAYDLGLAPGELALLEKRFAWCQFRRFPFEDHPPHVAMAWRSYAWKPIIVSAVCEETRGLVLWLDSATLFQTGNLDPVWTIIRDGGVYVLRGQSSLEQHCDPLVLEALAVPLAHRVRPELAAGVVGFNAAMAPVRDLVAQWRTHALNQAHIVPRRPALALHRPEQALLTILLYRGEADGGVRLPDGEIDISARAPVRWMTSRNKVSPGTPLWADLFVRLYYRTYKTTDQALWKLKHFHQTVIDGLHRALKEHFTVYLAQGGEAAVAVRAPRYSYYADPFIAAQGGQRWLLMEKFDYADCKGMLCAVALDADLRPGPPIPILPRQNHASFPFFFFHDGVAWLVPETCADGTVEIHACMEFPTRWKLVARPLENIDAADTVIFPHAGLWWLVTSVRPPGGGNRFLAVYFCDDFRQGGWRAHPVNESRLYHDRTFGHGRNAGPPISHQGKLLRPMQASRRFYGETLRLMEIELLTPTDYRERPYDGEHPADDIIKTFSPHHLNMTDGLTVFDVRDRARRAGGLWPGPR